MESLSLIKQRALVIGGSSGIGQAIAHGLQNSGATVAVLARTPEVEAAAVRLRENDPGARGFVFDASAVEALPEMAESVEREFGPIDILVNSQGTTIIKPAEEFSPADTRRSWGPTSRACSFPASPSAKPCAGERRARSSTSVRSPAIGAGRTRRSTR